MNYTLKDADKIRVGDTLTLEDGTKHEAVKDDGISAPCIECSLCGVVCNYNPYCARHEFHFRQIKP